MKEYLILKDFTGSQDGLSDGVKFTAGGVAALTDSLVEALGGVESGYVKPVDVAAAEIADAPAALADAVLEAVEGASGPESRETKVTAPEETKHAKPLNKMSKAELAAHAKTFHGLEFVPDSITVKAMIEAIEAAERA